MRLGRLAQRYWAKVYRMRILLYPHPRRSQPKSSLNSTAYAYLLVQRQLPPNNSLWAKALLLVSLVLGFQGTLLNRLNLTETASSLAHNARNCTKRKSYLALLTPLITTPIKRTAYKSTKYNAPENIKFRYFIFWKGMGMSCHVHTYNIQARAAALLSITQRNKAITARYIKLQKLTVMCRALTKVWNETFQKTKQRDSIQSTSHSSLLEQTALFVYHSNFCILKHLHSKMHGNLFF